MDIVHGASRHFKQHHHAVIEFFDLVEHENVGDVVHQIEHIVHALREGIDVLPVERA